MPLVDIEEFQEKVLAAKCRGVSITETLRDLGISRATYYRALGEIGEPRWREVKSEKILTRPDKTERIEEHLRKINEPEPKRVHKHKSQKIDLGMSGGNLPKPKNRNSDFIRGIASVVDHYKKDRKKIDDKYINGRDS